MASVSARITMKVITDETITAVGVSNPVLTHNEFKVDGVTLDSSTTPAISRVVSFTLTLSGGTGTIDLTALTGSNGVAVDLTGLKIQGIFIEPASTNAGVGTFVTGSTNGHNLGGSATFEITVGKGATGLSTGYAQTWNEDGQDVASADADIDVSGGTTDAFDITIIAG